MARISRTAALCVAASALVALAGCASGNAGGGHPSPAARWAGSVCSSAQSLDRSLKKLTGKLIIRENVGQSTLAQAQQQLRTRSHAVEADAARLAGAIDNAPPSGGRAVKKARRDLAAVADRSMRGVQQVRRAAAAVQAARTPAQLMGAITAAGSAVLGAVSDVRTLWKTLERFASSGPPELEDAFAHAPSCAALSGP